MRKTPVQGQHQKKCQRSAPQSVQKCVPQKASLLNSVLGENLEHAACHDPVHTGHEAGQKGLPQPKEIQREVQESPVKQTCTCHCRMVVKRTMSTVLLVHIGHDAGHPRPDDARREHNARCNGTSKAIVAHATDGTHEGVRGCQAPHPESLTQEAEEGGHMYWHGYPCASTRLLLPPASHQPRRH